MGLKLDDLTGIDLSRLEQKKFCIDSAKGHKFTIELDIPKSTDKEAHEKGKKQVDFSLSDETSFEYDHEAYLPFEQHCLMEKKFNLGLAENVQKAIRTKGLYLCLNLSIVRCDGFEPLVDMCRLDKAIDRRIYTKWGPGAFKYDHTSGLNRQLRMINNVAWISIDTRRNSEAYSWDFYSDRTCFSALDEKHMIEISLQISEASFEIGRKAVLIDGEIHYEETGISKENYADIEACLHQVQEVCMETVRVTKDGSLTSRPSGEGAIPFSSQQITSRDPIVWDEKSLGSIEKIQQNMDLETPEEIETVRVDQEISYRTLFGDVDTKYGLLLGNTELVYSPYRKEHEDKLVDLPFDGLLKGKASEEFLSQYYTLVDQMRKSYASHEE
jgi:hypothetical protein